MKHAFGTALIGPKGMLLADRVGGSSFLAEHHGDDGGLVSDARGAASAARVADARTGNV